MFTFSATLQIIGVNPYVALPDVLLQSIFEQSGKQKGPIPVRGMVNGKPFRQTLVRYAGDWRLYVNMAMLKNAPRRVGELLELGVEYDPEPRGVEAPPAFLSALQDSPVAFQNFQTLPPSLQNEIMRYLSNLKTEASFQKNLNKIMQNLVGEGTFYGRKLG